jgi:hypothetical protein|tara:strand:- start:113 stop:328 length:216 start_codon:yes stop_codon:yes gene_type:complete
MSWFKKLMSLFSDKNTLMGEIKTHTNGVSEEDFETVRARDSKGRYVADDPTTAKNEAYVKRRKRKTKKVSK